jgi:hypothetical protein
LTRSVDVEATGYPRRQYRVTPIVQCPDLTYLDRIHSVNSNSGPVVQLPPLPIPSFALLPFGYRCSFPGLPGIILGPLLLQSSFPSGLLLRLSSLGPRSNSDDTEVSVVLLDRIEEYRSYTGCVGGLGDGEEDGCGSFSVDDETGRGKAFCDGFKSACCPWLQTPVTTIRAH